MQTNKDILRVATSGSVDVGKSTLLGRILYETKCVYLDQLDTVKKISASKGNDLDLSLLLDGLAEEREQGITIDVAYIYLQTQLRKFIIADGPGHKSYTNQMFNGASVSDVVLSVIDAREGLTEQSKRHIFICSLLQIKHLFIVVNKMDLVDYSEEDFEKIIESYKKFSEKLDFHTVTWIPVSALKGDNVVSQSTNMPWYKSKSLLESLEQDTFCKNINTVDFRLPIQSAIKSQDFRGYMGTIASGAVEVGMDVTILPSGETSQIASIEGNQAVTVTLADEIDCSRGNMIVRKDNLPFVSHNLDCYLCVFSDKPITNSNYILKHTTQNVQAHIDKIFYEIDVNTLKRINTTTLTKNAIGRISISTSDDLFFDTYKENKVTGSFILIDPTTYETVGAGMIKKDASQDNIFYEKTIEKSLREIKQGHKGSVFWFTGLSGSGKTTLVKDLERNLFQKNRQVIVLDGDNVRLGLCKDLGFNSEDRYENIRRVAEIAKILSEAGFIVLCSFISPLYVQRNAAQFIIGKDFNLVYVECSIEKCIERDVKGLYKKVLNGEISNFTGISKEALYEVPITPQYIVRTEEISIDESVDHLQKFIISQTVL